MLPIILSFIVQFVFEDSLNEVSLVGGGLNQSNQGLAWHFMLGTMFYESKLVNYLEGKDTDTGGRKELGLWPVSSSS